MTILYCTFESNGTKDPNSVHNQDIKRGILCVSFINISYKQGNKSFMLICVCICMYHYKNNYHE